MITATAESPNLTTGSKKLTPKKGALLSLQSFRSLRVWFACVVAAKSWDPNESPPFFGH